jgi:DNA-binding helix-hairpin-helix protein with protein kinase domain
MTVEQDITSRYETELERRRQLRDRRTHDVVELISRRSELVGINPWADHVIESVAWTA